MQKETFMARLLEGIQIQFRPLDEVQRETSRRSRISEEDKKLIRDFLEGLRSGVHGSFVVPIADKKDYAKVKRLIHLVAKEQAFPVTVVKHPNGIAVWGETADDRKEKEVFRASLNGTIK